MSFMPFYVQSVYIGDSKARNGLTGHLCVFCLPAGRGIALALCCGVFF